MEGRSARTGLVVVTALLAAPKLVHLWSSSPIFSLGFLVAPWAVWWVLRRPQATPAPDLVRFSLLFLTLGLAVLGWYLAAPFLALWSVVAALLLVASEKGQIRASLLSLIVLAVTVPPPGFDMLLADAQLGVARVSGVVLAAIGIPIVFEAFTLVTPTYRFTVTPACSGFAGLLSTLALIGMTATHLAPGRRRVVLALALGLGITALLNVLRVIVLVWVTEMSGPMLIESAFHEGVSLVLSLIAVLLVLPLLLRKMAEGEPRIIVEGYA